MHTQEKQNIQNSDCSDFRHIRKRKKMLFDLFLKLLLTPVNIFGLVWNIAVIVGMCFIFKAWKEQWWKSLMPLYGTYIIYKYTWKKQKWLCFVQLLFNVTGAKCLYVMRKHIAVSLFHAIKTFIEKEQIDFDISVSRLLICVVVCLNSMLLTFILTRITYMKRMNVRRSCMV